MARRRKCETVYCRDLAGWWYYRITTEGFSPLGGRQARPIVDPVEQEQMRLLYRDATDELMNWRTMGVQNRGVDLVSRT